MPKLMTYSFGEWLRSVRTSTVDPTTQRIYTQGRIAELLHTSQAKIAQWERNENRTVTPEDGILLADIFNRPVSEIMEALGWPAQSSLTPAERRAVAAVRRLSAEPILLEGALLGLEGMPAALGPHIQGQPRRSKSA